MGRSNLIILFFGIFACIALSLMMSHVAGVKEQKTVHPAVLELQSLFGDDMKRKPKLTFVQRERRRVASLTLYPKKVSSTDRMATVVGRHLARLRGINLRFDELEVTLKHPEDPKGEGRVIPVKIARGASRFAGRFSPSARRSTPGLGSVKSSRPKGAASARRAIRPGGGGAKPAAAKPPGSKPSTPGPVKRP